VPCWNPAVPPPPVDGGAVGYELADGDADGDGDSEGDGDGLGEELSCVLGELPGDELAEASTPGDDEGSDAGPGDDVQAVITAAASNARIAQAITASLRRSPVRPAMTCTFMEPAITVLAILARTT
jgi:hypothetical protein